jgi:hypothetical protein
MVIFYDYGTIMKQLISFCLLCLFILSACGSTAPASDTTITPVFAFTETVVGPNRLPIGLIKAGSPVNDPQAQVTLRFFNLDVDSKTAVGDATATYYGKGLPAAVYVANFTFPSAGNWGVEINVQLAGMTTPSTTKLQLPVSERAIAPKVGDLAISAETLTVASTPDVSQLVSMTDPDLNLYQVSLSAALTQAKPIAVLFATPGFCRTAVCGPSLKVFSALQRTFGDKITFIHSEIYRFPFGDSFSQQNAVFQAAMTEGRNLTNTERKTGVSEAYFAWGLQSEPWLFLVDGQGLITARFEGGLTAEELTPLLTELAK